MQPRAVVKVTEPGEAQVRETRRRATLLAVNDALSTNLDLRAGVTHALEIVRRHHDAIRSTIVLTEEGTGKLACEAPAGADEPGDERVARISSPITLDNRMAGVIGIELRLETARDPHTVQFLGLLGSLIAGFARIHRLVETERRRLIRENARLRDKPVERFALQPAAAPDRAENRSLRQVLEAVEKEALAGALKTARGNRAKAARLLATTERIFNYRVRKYGIDWKRFRVRLQ